MGQPLPVSAAWRDFATEACKSPVANLLESTEPVEFGYGPDQIYASYLSDVGTLLSVNGIAVYTDAAGVKMRAEYFARWYNPSYTLSPDTVWTFKASSITKLGPVAPPQTLPAAEQ